MNLTIGERLQRLRAYLGMSSKAKICASRILRALDLDYETYKENVYNIFARLKTNPDAKFQRRLDQVFTEALNNFEAAHPDILDPDSFKDHLPKALLKVFLVNDPPAAKVTQPAPAPKTSLEEDMIAMQMSVAKSLADRINDPLTSSETVASLADNFAAVTAQIFDARMDLRDNKPSGDEDEKPSGDEDEEGHIQAHSQPLRITPPKKPDINDSQGPQ